MFQGIIGIAYFDIRIEQSALPLQFGIPLVSGIFRNYQMRSKPLFVQTYGEQGIKLLQCKRYIQLQTIKINNGVQVRSIFIGHIDLE